MLGRGKCEKKFLESLHSLLWAKWAEGTRVFTVGGCLQWEGVCSGVLRNCALCANVYYEYVLLPTSAICGVTIPVAALNTVLIGLMELSWICAQVLLCVERESASQLNHCWLVQTS